ncbi:MAG: hypothetical protein N2045_05650 [Fimbriimonadales bacterium]|jgi:hypothetical protein|nr:hypothetical protein [Fimbriimonadales bacterium]
MRQPSVVQEVLAIRQPEVLASRVPDVAEACAMARMGETDPRELLRHLVEIVEKRPEVIAESRAGMILGDLIDLLADEIRNSTDEADIELVARAEAVNKT